METHENINQEQKSLIKRAIEGVLMLLGVADLVNYQKVINNTLFFLFILFIGIFQIGHNLMGERLNRSISTRKQEVKEARWEYMTIKSDLMFRSKQSEIAKLLTPRGINELVVPPQTIITKKGEY